MNKTVFFQQRNMIYFLFFFHQGDHTFSTSSNLWKKLSSLSHDVCCIWRYTGFPFTLCQSVHMHTLSRPGSAAIANSHFVSLPSYKSIVCGIRPVSCKKDYCCMYTILNDLFVTLVCTLKQVKVFFFFFSPPDGRTRSG